MICSRKQANVDAAVDKLREELKVTNHEVIGMVCNVGKPDDRTNVIAKTVEHFGGLDILILNAACNPHVGPLIEVCVVEVEN